MVIGKHHDDNTEKTTNFRHDFIANFTISTKIIIFDRDSKSAKRSMDIFYWQKK